jgi:hypothetical protein
MHTGNHTILVETKETTQYLDRDYSPYYSAAMLIKHSFEKQIHPGNCTFYQRQLDLATILARIICI